MRQPSRSKTEMSFVQVIVTMGLLGSPLLGLFAWFWVKSHPSPQGPTEVAESTSKLVERFGVSFVLLIFTGFVLWKLAQWAKPKADLLIDSTLDKAKALPELLEQNRKLGVAQEARDKAIIHALEMQTELMKDLRERVDAQSKRTQLMAEAVTELVKEQRNATAASNQLTIKIETLIEILRAK